jgi:hypothetical protein
MKNDISEISIYNTIFEVNLGMMMMMLLMMMMMTTHAITAIGAICPG